MSHTYYSTQLIPFLQMSKLHFGKANLLQSHIEGRRSQYFNHQYPTAKLLFHPLPCITYKREHTITVPCGKECYLLLIDPNSLLFLYLAMYLNRKYKLTHIKTLSCNYVFDQNQAGKILLSILMW